MKMTLPKDVPVGALYQLREDHVQVLASYESLEDGHEEFDATFPITYTLQTIHDALATCLLDSKPDTRCPHVLMEIIDIVSVVAPEHATNTPTLHVRLLRPHTIGKCPSVGS